MAENVDFFSDKKKVNYTLTGICVAALFFVLVCPMASYFGVGLSGSQLSTLYKMAGESTFFIYCLYFFPVIAGALTFFAPQVVAAVPSLKNEKTARWIFGAILLLPFFIFVFSIESGIGMGAGVILYLLLSIAYFVVNFLSKE